MKAIITLFQWVLVLLMCCSLAVPYTHSGFVPYFQLLPSFDVMFWMLAVLLLLASMLFKMRPVLPSVVLLFATVLLVWRTHGSLPDYNEDGPYRELSVLCLNVGQFSNDTAEVNTTIATLLDLDPDIVCLQEFGLYYKWPDVEAVSEDFARRINMPYYDFTPFPGNIFGTAFFSKHPICSSDTIFSMLSHTNEAKSYSIDIGEREVSIMNMHLQSYNLMGRNKDEKGFFESLRETLSRRKSQVSVMLDKPTDIMVGDINASPGSIYYQNIAGRYLDAQRAMGLAMLPTHGIIPTRLDYIFLKHQYRLIDFERCTGFPSDHYGLMATIGI